jgi:uncharacterized protein HemY
VSDLRVGTESADADAPSSANAVQVAISNAKDFLDDGEARAARKILEEALATSARHPDLLWLLADAEFADGDLVAGRGQVAEAVLLSGGDAAAAGRQIGVLSRNGLLREALLAAEKIPAARGSRCAGRNG